MDTRRMGHRRKAPLAATSDYPSCNSNLRVCPLNEALRKSLGGWKILQMVQRCDEERCSTQQFTLVWVL